MGFLDSLVSGISTVTDFATDFISSELFSGGLAIADQLGAFGSNETQRRTSKPIRMPATRALPPPISMYGGSQMAAPSPIGMTNGGAQLTNASWRDYLPDVGVPGPGVLSPGQAGCITPRVVQAHLRMPMQVDVPHPTQPGRIVTYVRAPRVKYRVSVSRAGGRRRCSGG